MPDLISRLSETLDEVERLARACEPGAGSAWSSDGGSVLDEDGLPLVRTARGTDVFVRHLALWDPQAVLRLVAAHREVIAEHRRALRRLRESVGGAPEHVALVTDRFKSLQRVIKLLAAGWGVQDEEG